MCRTDVRSEPRTIWRSTSLPALCILCVTCMYQIHQSSNGIVLRVKIILHIEHISLSRGRGGPGSDSTRSHPLKSLITIAGHKFF